MKRNIWIGISICMSVGILLANSAMAEVVPNNILRAAYCEGAVTEQLRLIRPNIPNGIDGKPMLSSDGKLILPELANNPYYPPPNIDEIGKKNIRLRLTVRDYLKQHPADDSFTKMLYMAGVESFDSDTILNASQCNTWPDQEKRKICLQLTAPNAEKLADCIKE